MFDFLKKKITGLVDKIAGKGEGEQEKAIPKEEKKVPEPQIIEKPAPAEHRHGKTGEKPKHVEAPGPEPKKEPAKRHEATPVSVPKAEEKKVERKAEAAPKLEKEAPKKEHAPKEEKKEPVHAPKPVEEKKTGGIFDIIKPKASLEEKKSAEPARIIQQTPKQERVEAPNPPKEEKIPAKEAKPPPKEVSKVPEQKKQASEKKDDKVKLSILTQVKSVFSGEVELSEKDVSSALDDFELELLEGDVALEVADQIKEELRRELVGKKVKKSELQAQIASIFLNSIKGIMSENTGTPILEQVRGMSARPVKVMFTGPNGSGKTTTIAKVANLLKKAGFSVVIAAADTFRAAAIEQMEIHGERLGIKVIKGKYGADPTSVAFDAVNHAKAHNIDVVLIDTAGRQETNLNLLNELKKMARIINPEIKVYVAESVAGNSVISQVESFHKELKLDGVILTKLDCDAKGGTVISISKVTHVPVLYVTTGQGYEDIEEFDPGRIADNIAG